jgi:alkylation response protein AidB-like acyl-CoA dehydrogenase
LTVCFAWLITPDGQNHGIHVFAVRLRDDEGKCMPGVRIADNGTKMGVCPFFALRMIFIFASTNCSNLHNAPS